MQSLKNGFWEGVFGKTTGDTSGENLKRICYAISQGVSTRKNPLPGELSERNPAGTKNILKKCFRETEMAKNGVSS